MTKNGGRSKICPILPPYMRYNTKGMVPVLQQCIKSRCRWWVGDDCAVPWAGRWARGKLMHQILND